ncbi:Hypothetical predicted protein [Podarcis lilfordi]|uniref:Uncharacterized protein n=1 Tax=Podarcis lilfordi TaxID=74358 RepID=A0AA35PF70_9SAUR|nr:Hypothetical predicted protein [Podarcis lilfordi]
MQKINIFPFKREPREGDLFTRPPTKLPQLEMHPARGRASTIANKAAGTVVCVSMRKRRNAVVGVFVRKQGGSEQQGCQVSARGSHRQPEPDLSTSIVQFRHSTLSHRHRFFCCTDSIATRKEPIFTPNDH